MEPIENNSFRDFFYNVIGRIACKFGWDAKTVQRLHRLRESYSQQSSN